jgi:hypothetical protein
MSLAGSRGRAKTMLFTFLTISSSSSAESFKSSAIRSLRTA